MRVMITEKGNSAAPKSMEWRVYIQVARANSRAKLLLTSSLTAVIA